MARRSWIGDVALNIRTAGAIGRGVWRLVAGRAPWHSRRDVRRRRRFIRIG